MPDMNKKTILVVDDDHEIVRAITITLEREGYHVLNAYDGLQALDCVTSREVHLIIIDVMMPKLDGLSAVMKIREKKNLPIIILSAKGEDSDKILGLSMGADEYISKPFNPMELVARVKSQLRRYTQLGAKKVEEQANVYTVGPIVLDEEKKSVTVDGDEVALTPIEFNILRLLMKNPGRIYSSAQIYELVWKEDSLGAETSVSVHIRHLRQKLEINPSEPRYLKVVWGLGYKMEDKK